MAGIALELAALAFLGYALMGRDDDRDREKAPRYRGGPQPVLSTVEAIPADDVAAPEPPARKAGEPLPFSEPMQFIAEPADEGARYYRARAEGVELVAGFYSDGRVRLADSQNHRFAGLLQGGRADLLELDNSLWSEAFVRITPGGSMQLELRGGPYDARVLACEPFDEDDKVI